MKIRKRETYADFLRRIRRTANYTQDDLALRLGFSRRSICAWELGKGEPSLSSKREIDLMAKRIK